MSDLIEGKCYDCREIKPCVPFNWVSRTSGKCGTLFYCLDCRPGLDSWLEVESVFYIGRDDIDY
ncbi:hypothetical protein M1O20_03820 [Dehalococcoidia bacterium]|nr:hypothetical protein [Dehalococcoidia bacterium]MCL0059600.1 hypothetical protein [Dehalococcoidia bacterium]